MCRSIVGRSLRAPSRSSPPARCHSTSFNGVHNVFCDGPLKRAVWPFSRPDFPSFLKRGLHEWITRAPCAVLSTGCLHRRGLKPQQPVLVGNLGVVAKLAVPSHDGL